MFCGGFLQCSGELRPVEEISVLSQVTFVICITGDLSPDERKKFRLNPAMVLGWLLAAALQWASHVLGAA